MAGVESGTNWHRSRLGDPQRCANTFYRASRGHFEMLVLLSTAAVLQGSRLRTREPATAPQYTGARTDLRVPGPGSDPDLGYLGMIRAVPLEGGRRKRTSSPFCARSRR